MKNKSKTMESREQQEKRHTFNGQSQANQWSYSLCVFVEYSFIFFFFSSSLPILRFFNRWRLKNTRFFSYAHRSQLNPCILTHVHTYTRTLMHGCLCPAFFSCNIDVVAFGFLLLFSFYDLRNIFIAFLVFFIRYKFFCVYSLDDENV